jgi:hypothetical protein
MNALATLSHIMAVNYLIGASSQGFAKTSERSQSERVCSRMAADRRKTGHQNPDLLHHVTAVNASTTTYSPTRRTCNNKSRRTDLEQRDDSAQQFEIGEVRGEKLSALALKNCRVQQGHESRSDSAMTSSTEQKGQNVSLVGCQID